MILIIPAAGRGTRMKSVNPDIPKEMLPLGNRPAIQYAVEEGISAGIKDIVIIISSVKDIIREYFEDSKRRLSLFPEADSVVEEINRRSEEHHV